jgi:2-methylcitrate dehydratase PrpD
LVSVPAITKRAPSRISSPQHGVVANAAGNRQCILDGALTKRMQAGQAAARALLDIERPEDIGAVTIEADPAGHSDQFSRGPEKRRPTQVVEAQFAQPFLVATALVHGRVGIADVDGLGDASVLALSDRIAGVGRDGRPKGWVSITVQRTDGRSVTVEATDPIGSPQKPLANTQFEAKFRDCARNAVRPLSDSSVDAVLAAIARLEMLPDARQLMTPFAGNG